jgi:hypothetical protein
MIEHVKVIARRFLFYLFINNNEEPALHGCAQPIEIPLGPDNNCIFPNGNTSQEVQD